MIRDPFYRDVVDRLNGQLHEEAFERCAQDLLRQIYPTGARNDQRNKAYWNVDLKATKELRLGRAVNLQLSAEVFNALDDDTYIIYNPFFEAGQNINGINEATRRFGRRWQVGVKLAF